MALYKIGSNEVYYQIFVSSFADGNGDGTGDLKGITKNLDYLNDGKGGGLGVGGIWLTPIHLSDSFHKYDVLDYKKVAVQFGGTDDFKELIKEAHQRGIKVILDMGFNCVSNRHPWFLEALNDKRSKYRDYFYFWDKYQLIDGYSSDDSWGGLPVWNEVLDEDGTVIDRYIGIYGKTMPDLNFHNPMVRGECRDVASFWLALGADGFRLDSAMHIFSPFEAPGKDFHQLNIDWWKEFYDHCKSLKPDVYLVGEVCAANFVRARYMQGFKSDFHFCLGDKIADVVTGGSTADEFRDFLQNEYRAFRDYNRTDYINAPFLSNHDQARYAGNGCTLPQLKMSANIYLTLEGLPFVYYGEELGLQGPRADGVLADIGFEWPFGREDILVQSRVAFPWNNEYQTRQIYYADGGNIPDLSVQMRDENSLYNHYKKLIHIRKQFDAFKNGSISFLTTERDLISYKIDNGKSNIVVIHNISDKTQNLRSKFKYNFVLDINRNKSSKFDPDILIENSNSYIFYN